MWLISRRSQRPHRKYNPNSQAWGNLSRGWKLTIGSLVVVTMLAAAVVAVGVHSAYAAGRSWRCDMLFDSAPARRRKRTSRCATSIRPAASG